MEEFYEWLYKSDDFVYFIFNEDSGLYKIGITGDFKRRLGQLRTQSGCTLYVLYCAKPSKYCAWSSKAVEKRAHAFFKKHRIVGEWFRFNDKQVCACMRLLEDTLEPVDFQTALKEFKTK